MWWLGLSLLGSMAVMGPAGLVIGAWLAAGSYWRLALNWLLLFGAGMALVVVSKLVFIGWGIGIASLGFTGFSGHAMRAGAVLPVACYLALKNVGRPLRRAGVFCGVALALLVAAARLYRDVHSISEVVSGSLLGLGVAALFFYSAKESGRLVVSPLLVLASLCCLMFTPRVEPVPTEAIITKVALRLSGRPQPFMRSDWRVREMPRPPR